MVGGNLSTNSTTAFAASLTPTGDWQCLGDLQPSAY
jgi:hypothetical protein